MRQTKHRQAILDLLDTSTDALTAAQIHNALPRINLVTIYRNLESFVKEGQVTKLHLGNSEALYETQHEPHHHAVCNDCKKVIHFTIDDENLKKEFSLPGFDIETVEVTLRGHCHETKRKTTAKSKTPAPTK